jgi:hypothetical protein
MAQLSKMAQFSKDYIFLYFNVIFHTYERIIRLKKKLCFLTFHFLKIFFFFFLYIISSLLQMPTFSITFSHPLLIVSQYRTFTSALCTIPTVPLHKFLKSTLRKTEDTPQKEQPKRGKRQKEKKAQTNKFASYNCMSISFSFLEFNIYKNYPQRTTSIHRIR